MNDIFSKSKSLLLRFSREPGGMSFFPSSFLWDESITHENIGDIFKGFFLGSYSDTTVKNNKVNLYIHIPFCNKICSYCNCFKTFLKNESQIDEYLSYLDREAKLLISLHDGKKININTIFIGGGTPNILSEKQFKTLFTIINTYFDISSQEQFIIDCHPNFLDKSKIDLFHKNGVNRITIAIQTLNSDILSKNNRDSYDVEKIKNNILLLKKYGIKINIDLLIGMNGQTIDSIKTDLDFFTKLGVDNISDHYMAISNNMNYHLDDGYMDMFHTVKEYIKNLNIKNVSENLQESYFASKKSSTISLGAEGVTNIFAGMIYKKPGIDVYYKELSSGKIPVQKGILLDIKQEMIKYFYLNIFHGVNTQGFQELFEMNIFEIFGKEIEFLLKKKIIRQGKNTLYKNCKDLDMYIYLNILFIMPYLGKDFPNLYHSINEKDLGFYFYPDGSRIDE